MARKNFNSILNQLFRLINDADASVCVSIDIHCFIVHGRAWNYLKHICTHALVIKIDSNDIGGGERKSAHGFDVPFCTIKGAKCTLTMRTHFKCKTKSDKSEGAEEQTRRKVEATTLRLVAPPVANTIMKQNTYLYSSICHSMWKCYLSVTDVIFQFGFECVKQQGEADFSWKMRQNVDQFLVYF